MRNAFGQCGFGTLLYLGFVVDDRRVRGRPVGVAVARDGSLLVSEDGNGTIWRISYRGR